jgi:hypothetical protein
MRCNLATVASGQPLGSVPLALTTQGHTQSSSSTGCPGPEATSTLMSQASQQQQQQQQAVRGSTTAGAGRSSAGGVEASSSSRGNLATGSPAEAGAARGPAAAGGTSRFPGASFFQRASTGQMPSTVAAATASPPTRVHRRTSSSETGRGGGCRVMRGCVPVWVICRCQYGRNRCPLCAEGQQLCTMCMVCLLLGTSKSNTLVCPCDGGS